jgi:hypothetical protein
MLEELAVVDQVAEALAEAEREKMLQQLTELETVAHHGHFQYLEQQQIMLAEAEEAQLLQEEQPRAVQFT